MKDLLEALRGRVSGEVRFDEISRVLYSTDASIYEIVPAGVVIPRIPEDVDAVVELAHAYSVPITARGGGTSLVGQSIGSGLMIDFSKYLNNILEVNREEQWVRVQPGVVLDRLNQVVAAHGLVFGPDVATSSRANLGGLIGNNCSGARSIVYGKTLDHVLQLNVLLSNGERAVLKACSEAEVQQALRKGGVLGSIYRTVTDVVHRNRAEVERRFPRILRRVGGYNLDALLRPPLDLTRLIVGSEGTLAVVTEAKLKLVPRPGRRVLAILHFSELEAALEAVAPLLAFGPSAVELLDRFVLEPIRRTQEYRRRLTFVQGQPEALLLVEFQGEAQRTLKAKLDDLGRYAERHKLGYACLRMVGEAEQDNVWAIRKAGLGLLMGTRGERKPVGFVEDTAVPVERLPEYIKRFRELLAAHGTEACFYAHASVGCLHIRPLLDLKTGEDRARMRQIAEDVSDLVLEYGGAMSGEHGDGLARSCFNEKMFGRQLYAAFKEVKRAFDPENILNPGKIVDAQDLTENLRTAAQGAQITTFLDFSEEGGLARAVETCNGNGVCRKQNAGTMCPSYMATLEEAHSTRGRANVLRAVLSGRLPVQKLTSPDVYRVMDLCLACKGCKGECPTNVDMAKLKYEFLYQYHKKHRLPLRDRLFGHIETLSKWGCATAPVSNMMLASSPVRWGMEKVLGIDRRRPLPRFASEPFTRWFARHLSEPGAGERGRVVLFNDTFMTYNYPEVGVAAVRLLEAAGYSVLLAEKRCCGRPFISKGMLAHARRCAQHNVAALLPWVDQGVPIVGCEPSCILTFRDEYPDLLTDGGVRKLAENSYLFEEFFARDENGAGLAFHEPEYKLLLHGHCHMKALAGLEQTLQLLHRLPAAEVQALDSGCCGMAGAFGFEKEHYEMSLKIGRDRLFPVINEKDATWRVVAPGVSCRQQIEHATGRRAWHPVEILAEALVVNEQEQG